LPFGSIASLVAKRQSSVVLTSIIVAIFPHVPDWIIKILLQCDVFAAANAVALIVLRSVTSNTSTSPASDQAIGGTAPTVQATVPATENPHVPKGALEESHVSSWMPSAQTFSCIEKEPGSGFRGSLWQRHVQREELIWRQCIGTSRKFHPWHQNCAERSGSERVCEICQIWSVLNIDLESPLFERQCFSSTARFQANLHQFQPATVRESFLSLKLAAETKNTKETNWKQCWKQYWKQSKT
jgi:hypothetical protein